MFKTLSLPCLGRGHPWLLQQRGALRDEQFCALERPCSLTVVPELICDRLLASLLGFCLVNRLHEHALVLEDVALALQVHLVVHVFVNLLRARDT